MRNFFLDCFLFSDTAAKQILFYPPFEKSLYSIPFHRPTRKAYNILLDAFSISGMVEQARTVFKSMRRDK
jgi:pentatricopeptide repeat protein